jgi:hypothetical protein
VEQKSTNSLTWLFAIALVLALTVFGVGMYMAGKAQGFAMLAAGSVSVIAVLVAWPLGKLIQDARITDQAHQQELITTLRERLEQLSIIMNMMSEQQLLSDRARAVAFREKDRDALRRAIQEDMNRSDWEAANRLVNEMETSFGYKQEADRFRDEIRGRQQETVRKQVGDVVAVIDRHIRGEQWPEALREAEKLAQQFPNDEQVRRLPQDIEARKQAHKKQLMDSWREAVDRHDIDGSIEILKQLDMYLTPQEAGSFQDTARGVFKEKLNNLRTQFTLAVQDHHWSEAVKLGETIVAEFPNTRVAQEVKEKMDALRQRAGGGEVARV